MNLKTSLESIRLAMEKGDKQREKVIKASRDVVKQSKQVIYAVHRGEIHKAEKLHELMKNCLKEMQKMDADATDSGGLKIAEQEYVEATCYLRFVKDRSVPVCEELGVSDENYLLGLCDLTGELVRYAINSAIKDKVEITLEVKEFVTDLYYMLSKFDFRNGEIRRKFDSIKYDLKKLEDVAFELKMKGKF